MAHWGNKNFLKETNGELSPIHEANHPSFVQQQLQRNTFKSPTDNIFSPCTQRLVSRRGVAALVRINRKFPAESQDKPYNENAR